MANNLGITEKGKIGQFFCKHRNNEWFVEQEGMFASLVGEKRVNVCKDCGKFLGKYIAEYEGPGFK